MTAFVTGRMKTFGTKRLSAVMFLTVVLWEGQDKTILIVNLATVTTERRAGTESVGFIIDIEFHDQYRKGTVLMLLLKHGLVVVFFEANVFLSN